MTSRSQDLKIETLALLEQFGQVILSGPPGTGKTRLALHAAAASILGKPDAKTLPIGKDSQFALVQFHPSYNYEDFVRGIRVKTDSNNNVVYETVNRVFGDMAERAAASDDPHVLVIDEINRANVSAVLGELIYGLEYRGKEVQTPYKVNGKKKGNEGGKGEGNATLRRRLCQYSGCNGEDKGEGSFGLVIPENLKIIGTMNTADRTIGQIDYAVRRRFAFVHCPPQRSILKNKTAETFFDLVDGVFAHLSADHDKEDVCIGHSYFLAGSEAKLARKIIYQIVPILWEYLKDGVLMKEAEKEIGTIDAKARTMLESAGRVSPGSRVYPKWRWMHIASGSPPSEWLSLRQMALALVRHYALVSGKPKNLAELQAAFPKECAWCHGIALDFNAVKGKSNEKGYFTGDEEKIELPDGTVAVVCGEWGAGGDASSCFEEFQKRARELGYQFYNNDPEVWVLKDGSSNARAWVKPSSTDDDKWQFMPGSSVRKHEGEGARSRGVLIGGMRDELQQSGKLEPHPNDESLLLFTQESEFYTCSRVGAIVRGTNLGLADTRAMMTRETGTNADD